MGKGERGTERIRSGEVEGGKKKMQNDKMPVLTNKETAIPSVYLPPAHFKPISSN